jgi:preprotein translocase subunit SecA
MDRNHMTEELIKKAHQKIEKTDLSEGRSFLEADFGLRTLCGWMRHKFGIETTPDEFRDLEHRDRIVNLLMQRAEQAYSEKETEYPVLAGISRFTTTQGAQVTLDREGLVDWVKRRFHVDLALADVKLNRDELKLQLQQFSRQISGSAEQQYEQAEAKVNELFGKSGPETTVAVAGGGNGTIDSLTDWMNRELGYRPLREDLSRMNRKQLELALDGAVDDRFHPEMRRMERQILLNIVDEAWKNHLLTMDHLRSSVGLKGYAQMDPKVEYKREGMRLFEAMWTNIGERVTDLIFRMESFNEDFIRSTWVDAKARHDEAHSAIGQTHAAAANTVAQRVAESSNRPSDESRTEPIRNLGPKVGRNDPCPCGSGKKYKSCCQRKQV